MTTRQFDAIQVAQSLVVPATASATTYGVPFQVWSPWESLVLLAKIPSLSASTLNLYVQESWDGGATWADVAAFTQVTGGAGTQQTRIAIGRASGAGAAKSVAIGTTGSAPPALTAPAFCDGPWAETLRLVSVSGAGSNSGSVTVNVNFTPVQQSH